MTAIDEHPSAQGPQAEAPQAQAIPRTRVAGIVIAYTFIFCIALPAFLIATGLKLDQLAPMGFEAGPLTRTAGALLLLVGFAMAAAAMLLLSRCGRGLPISHLPPRVLVASGLYHNVRHPIYVGCTVAFAGAAMLLHSPWSLMFSLPLFILGWMCYATFYEEPVLIQRFGDSYREFRDRTALLLPRRFSRRAGAAISAITSAVMRAAGRLPAAFGSIAKGSFAILIGGFFSLAGALLACLFLVMDLDARGLGTQPITVIISMLAISILLFARLFAFLLSRGNRKKLEYRAPALVSWGGLFGMLPAVCASAWMYQVPPLRLADALILPVFCGYAIGQLGLVPGAVSSRVTSNGTDYSRSRMSLADPQSGGGPPDHAMASPLHTSVLCVVIIVILSIPPIQAGPEGFLTSLALMLYGTGRSVIAFLSPAPRTVGGVLSPAHIGCLAVFACGWVLLFLIDPPWIPAHAALGRSSMAAAAPSLQLASDGSILYSFAIGVLRHRRNHE